MNLLAAAQQNATGAPEVPEGFIFDRTALAPADVGIIFGNSHISPTLVETVLSHQSYAPMWIISGGVIAAQDEQGHLTEAEVIYRGLVDGGMDPSSLIMEKNATNTQQNVEWSRIMAQRAGLEVHRAVLCGHIVAGTRFLETMNRRWTGVLAMQVSANPYGVPAAEWRSHPDFLSAATDEYHKTLRYRQMGRLEPVDLDHLSAVVASLQDDGPQPF